MHPSAARHFERPSRENDRILVRAGRLIEVHFATGSARGGGIMRRLCKLLIELPRGDQRALNRDETKEEA
jgi:hypothetical protein